MNIYLNNSVMNFISGQRPIRLLRAGPTLLLKAGFQEQGQCFFIGLSCSIPTIGFYFFFLSLLSVCALVLWGWGLQTDRVYITLSQHCTVDIF